MTAIQAGRILRWARQALFFCLGLFKAWWSCCTDARGAKKIFSRWPSDSWRPVSGV